MPALKHAESWVGNARLHLSWTPSQSYIDVQIQIYSCDVNQVSLTGFSTDQEGECVEKDNPPYDTQYAYYAPQGGGVFSKIYRLNCRAHQITLTVDDNQGRSSQASATAFL